MAYSEFTLLTIHSRLGITLRQERLFDQVTPAEVSPWLQETLRMGQDTAFVSGKARCEFVVAPVLLACRQLSAKRFSILSGERLDVDPERGLVGECDFILMPGPPLPVVHTPVLIVVEAKRENMEAGMGQCAAQMVAAQLFNRNEGRPLSAIYGCVTTAESWHFLRLEETTLTIDQKRYFFNELGVILGTFLKIMALYESEAAAA